MVRIDEYAAHDDEMPAWVSRAGREHVDALLNRAVYHLRGFRHRAACRQDALLLLQQKLLEEVLLIVELGELPGADTRRFEFFHCRPNGSATRRMTLVVRPQDHSGVTG